MPPAQPPTFEVVEAGFLTTIQDAGRFGHRDVGVPLAGACDPVGLAVANLLVGNRADEAAIECTLLGPRLVALADVIVGLSGADLGATLQPAGRRLPAGRAHRVLAGDRIVFEGGGEDGCRAYIAVPGGISVPVVLGSRSTSLVGAFGGLDGRPFRAGDRISSNGPGRHPIDPTARWPGPVTPRPMTTAVRVLGASDLGTATTPAGDRAGALRTLERTSWRVAAASDRRGLRLDGPPIGGAGDAAAPSHGVIPGTIQLTPSGQPLVLLPDCGTIGGYPVIGVVIAADLWRLGQAAPGTTITFEVVDLETARHASAELRAWLADGERRIRSSSADSWDDLADDARG